MRTDINPNRTETMNMDEIPTPETDAAFEQWLLESDKSHRIRMGQKMESLERRLTVAREALTMIIDTSPSLEHAERMADRALKLTAPKL